jgi:hypothetical protein
VHFLVIGALLFVADHVVHSRRPPAASAASSPAPAASGGRIAVTEKVRSDLASEFTRGSGRPPSEAELNALVERWIDDEILYREGVARGFAESDPRVRQRIAEQMAYVLSSAVVVPEPTEADVRAWFDANKKNWVSPPLVDFTQVFVQGSDAAARARADALLTELNNGADPSGRGDVFSGGRKYRRRTLSELSATLGPEFVKGLAEQQVGTWALRPSRHGFHLVRIDEHTAGADPELASVRELVKLDRDKSIRESMTVAAVRALRTRWTIEAAK